MKRALTFSGVCCALLVGVFAVGAAQKGANFAGAWELDKAKSQLPQMQADSIKSATWTVTQDDKQLAREQKIERVEGTGGGPGGGGGRGGGMMGGGPLTVKLDGSETTAESQRGKSTSKAKWLNEGKTLEINTVSTFSTPNGDFTATMVEHWELADGGKTLKVHRKTESQRGTQESTWAFTKK